MFFTTWLLKLTRSFRKLKKLLRSRRSSPTPGLPTPNSAAGGTSQQAAEQLPEVAENIRNSTADGEAAEQPATLAAKNPPEFLQPPEPDDESPIWSQSMRRFSQEQPALYELIKGRMEEIRNLDADKWDTWLNQPLDMKANSWLRRCKAYLPRLKTVKSLATRLSNLDPHGLAPYVTTGVFVFIEVCPKLIHHPSFFSLSEL